MIQTRYHLFKKFLQYLQRGVTIFDVHSPLIADFTTEIIQDTRHYYAFSKIETLRQQLLTNTNTISIKDYGAGSKVNPSPIRQIRNIAKYAPVSPRIGQYLFKIAQWQKPRNILELGTSLGISTLYLASGQTKIPVYTFEGCPSTAQLAQTHFRQLKYNNINLFNQTFDEGLSAFSAAHEHVDLIYIDGNHQKGATLKYLYQLLPKIDENGIVILADFHWS